MIENRKEEHIRIAENQHVTSDHNFWDDVIFIHQAVPELDYDSIDTAITLLGKKLKMPMIISSMTGGTQLAGKINENLAAVAEKFQIGMGVGSMRAAVEKKELSETYSVINRFDIPMKIANIGAPQLIKQEKAAFTMKQIEYVFDLIGASHLIVHFNFLQEMVQPEGDKNSKGILKVLSEVAQSFPVIAKETGNGFSREAALLLKDAGVKAIDVGGMGGTSFAAIEFFRAEKMNDESKMSSGKTFWNWGIPSPASIKYCQVGLPIIGSGGLRTGLDLAKALVMGADAGGFARTLLTGADTGVEVLGRQILQILRDLKIVMFLTSSRNVKELKKAKYFVSNSLKPWLSVYGK